MPLCRNDEVIGKGCQHEVYRCEASIECVRAKRETIPVTMRLGDTPVLIPNTMVKT